MVAVHCVAHRLALACSQVFPELLRYKRTLISIYSYFSHSSNRVNSLREIQAVLEDPQIQARPLYDVRWLSFFNAVSAVRRTFKSLIVFFDEEAAEHNDPVAKGLMKQVSSYLFLAITHMLYDVLSQLTRLSKVFQKDLLEFSVILPSVDATISAISCSSAGPALTEFMQQIETNNVTFVEGQVSLRKSFVEEIVSNLKSRFPQTSVISSLILSSQHIPKDKTKLPTYGNSELDVLIEYFSKQCPTLSNSECKHE